MSTFKIKKMTNPYGMEDDVSSLHIDSFGDAYILPDLIGLEGEYTFSIWHKSLTDSEIIFNLFGQSYAVSSDSIWQKFSKTVEVTTLENLAITIAPAIGTETLLYESFLSEGNLDLSWYPAPEDLEDRFAKIEIEADRITSTVFDSETGQSKIEQTASEIRQEVTSLIQEERKIPIRYIRDWVYGNDFDDSSSWVSCQAYVGETNIAEGIIPTYIWAPKTKDEDGNPIEVEQIEPVISNPDLYTDGKLITYINSSVPEMEGEETIADKSSYITTTFTGETCLQIDLGEVRTDIDYITVWHDYSEAKSYNHRFEISEDGENWTELFNSEFGAYIETSDGKTYNFAKQLVAAQTSTILQTLENILFQVSGLNGQIGQLENKAGEISSTVATNKEAYDKFVNETYKELTEKIDSEDFAQSIVSTAGIVDTVIGKIDEFGYATSSQIEQNSNLWKATFSKIGINADEIIKNKEVSISMDSDGIRVTGTSDPEEDGVVHTIETSLTTSGLEGKYDSIPVFWIEKDSVKTERVHCNRGIDTDTIKILPMEYMNNNTKYGMLAFVKSGGSS